MNYAFENFKMLKKRNTLKKVGHPVYVYDEIVMSYDEVEDRIPNKYYTIHAYVIINSINIFF